MLLPMRGIHIFEKPYYREIRPMRGRPMRGPPVLVKNGAIKIIVFKRIIIGNYPKYIIY